MKPVVDINILAATYCHEAHTTIYKITEIAYQLIYLNQSLTIASLKIEDEYLKPYIQN